MGKIKRGNHFFISWIGDHGHHVHVYRDGKEVLKWDLDNSKAMKGKLTKRILKLIYDLKLEGLL